MNDFLLFQMPMTLLEGIQPGAVKKVVSDIGKMYKKGERVFHKTTTTKLPTKPQKLCDTSANWGNKYTMDFRSKHDHSDSSDGSDTSDPQGAPSVDNDYNNARAEVRNATKGIDRGVLLWRLVVKVTMIVVAITLTALTYVQLKHAETNEFLVAVSFTHRIYFVYRCRMRDGLNHTDTLTFSCSFSVR